MFNVLGQMPPSTQQQQQLAGPDSWQALFDGVDAAQAITVSSNYLDFGSCSRLQPAEPCSFTVSNNTGAKVLAALLVTPWQDPLGQLGKVAQVFQAFPESLELRPHSSATLRVVFRPPHDGVYYCQGLVLLAGLKAMRSFRLAQDAEVVPPWCIGIMASGNTFANLNPEYSPKVILSSSNITFPPCRLGEMVHQTLALLNKGDTPVHFKFTAASSSPIDIKQQQLGIAGAAPGVGWFGPFGALPSQGVLEPKSQKLVALRFQPQHLDMAQVNLTCIFNNTSANTTCVLLTGTACEPQLSWDVPDGQLFFRPTCIGASSQHCITIGNISQVPARWCWVVSKKLQDVVIFEPSAGVLRGFESTQVRVSFAPIKQQVYNARAALLLLPPNAAAGAAGSGGAADDNCQQPTSADANQDVEMEDSQRPADNRQNSPTDFADAEKLILTIIGEATQGALSIEPADGNFGAINVGYPARRNFQLTNKSNGVLRYSIELVNHAPELIDTEGAECDFGTAVAAADSNCETQHGSRDAWIDEPEGVVNARTSKSLTLTLLPRRRGEYKLTLNVLATTLPQQSSHPGMRSILAGSSSSPAAAAAGPAGLVATVPSYPHTSTAPAGSSSGSSNHKYFSRTHSTAESPNIMAKDPEGWLGDAAIFTAAGAAVGSTKAAMPLDKPPLAAVSVTAIACFPALLVKDVVSVGLPKQVAWQMLGIQQLNQELCSPVGGAEVEAQILADRGMLTNDKALMLLPPYKMDLGVVAAGDAARSFWVQFANEGPLPIDWQLHSYDAPEVELESWVETARPVSQTEKERAFVIENAILGMQPHSGTLVPGSTQQVHVTFNPVVEGFFQLPLFLRIKDGKHLQLQLSGQAVPASAQLPLTIKGSNSCVFAACPLGELDPPLQCYELRNGGPAPLHYMLDISPLQRLAKQNYSAEVIKFAGGSPLEGVVPPGEVAVFNWLFQPLEAKSYSVALPLTLGDAQPQPLLLRGRGYHPLQHPEAARSTAEETAQRWQQWLGFQAAPSLAPPGRILLPSQEMLDFGVCLPASTTKRLLLLHNRAAVPLAFVWDMGVFSEDYRVISGRLRVTPGTGEH
eukprot:GHRR01015437.1.p1 GENE.GHRR01015437.1~~GHRR01015437.1.p1  ORF type:complete len:1087 (+),score=398.72 GHRR01015437.1:1465-4725(+)